MRLNGQRLKTFPSIIPGRLPPRSSVFRHSVRKNNVVTGRLLNDEQLVSEVRETILNILAAAALKDDIILVLHQDRREHTLMNYANGFEKLPLLEQLSLTLFVSTYLRVGGDSVRYLGGIKINFFFLSFGSNLYCILKYILKVLSLLHCTT